MIERGPGLPYLVFVSPGANRYGVSLRFANANRASLICVFTRGSIEGESRTFDLYHGVGGFSDPPDSVTPRIQ